MFNLKHNLPELVADLRRAQGKWRQDQKELMEVLGTTLLSEAKKSYRLKARGQQGSDGVRWRKLKRGTLDGRVRRRSASRRIVKQRRKLAGQIRSATGKGSTLRKQKWRKKRKALFQKHERLIDKEVSRHEIGVDTGLQRSSASPGFSGQDGKGGNIFKVSQTRVTVGYNRTYSKFFDVARTIMPEVLPSSWNKKLGNNIHNWSKRILKEVGPQSGQAGSA
jgi:hypothetical protein